MATVASLSAYVIGVGLTKFIKPTDEVDYTHLSLAAGAKALLDAHLNYDDIETGIACYCYGDSTCGQRAFYQFGMTGIPVYNVNNNCATGSTGLYLARNLLTSNQADVIMVLGFEKMSPGSLKSGWSDRANPTGLIAKKMVDQNGWAEGPVTAQMFGNAGREYMARYGAKKEDFAEIARVNREHGTRNPYAQFQKSFTRDQILESQILHDPVTKFQACPTSSGAAAAVMVSGRWLDKHPELRHKAIEIKGMAMVTDRKNTYEGDAMSLVGYDMTKEAAGKAMNEAHITPGDVGVCELHDCFSTNEMITLPALGLCEEDKAHETVRKGDITYGGRVVVNPSGGLISKGHPLGATGIAQCAELVWHLRGWANNRLADRRKWALQHNLGLGGACVVGVYRRADGTDNAAVSDEAAARDSGLGYNPAVECRGLDAWLLDKVRSKGARSGWALDGADRSLKAQL